MQRRIAIAGPRTAAAHPIDSRPSLTDFLKMADIKLTPAEQALYEEVGSRGDYFRAAIMDRAAEQVERTEQLSRITTEAGAMIDVVMPASAAASTAAATVNDVVPPSDFEPVSGPLPGSESEPTPHPTDAER